MQEKYRAEWAKKATDMAAVWGENILQIAIYNRELTERGNLVVILNDDSIENIVKAHGLTKGLYKSGFEPPLVISENYIMNSLDSFPLEFLNIKTDHKNLLVHRDILTGLQFEKSYIRLEMERELKSKILLIKMAILDHYGNLKILKNLIRVSVHSIEPVLKGLLFLLDQEILLNHTDLITKADEVTDFKIDSLLTAVDFTVGKIDLDKKEIPEFFEQFTSQLQSLSSYIEQMELKIRT